MPQTSSIEYCCGTGIAADCGHLPVAGCVQQILEVCTGGTGAVVVDGGHGQTFPVPDRYRDRARYCWLYLVYIMYNHSRPKAGSYEADGEGLQAVHEADGTPGLFTSWGRSGQGPQVHVAS